MAQSWGEYFVWLEKRGLKTPGVPPVAPVKAKPSIAPIRGIKAVVWNLYGTLLRVSDGELLQVVDNDLRMQIALEKTLEQFNMWTSMTRKPGAPWKYLDQQYRQILDERRMQGSAARGDFPVVESESLWEKILERLMRKDYQWEQAIYGTREEFSQRVAFFYHACLQGFTVEPNAGETLEFVRRRKLRQGIWADTQVFSLPHFLHLLGREAGTENPGSLIESECSILSHSLGLRKPSQSFYKAGVKQFSRLDIPPERILYVSSVLRDDLSMAKSQGVKTVLLAHDQLSLKAKAADLKEPELRPDRLMTNLGQIGEILAR